MTFDESAHEDEAVGTRPRLEWPFTFTRAMSVALFGPGGIGLLGGAMLAFRVGENTTRGWWVASPVGRSVFGAACLFLLGLAALILVAGVRHVPALRLDGHGVTAWQGWRIRHVPWDDVVGFEPVHQVSHNWRFVILARNAASLRIFQRVTGGSVVDVHESCARWLEQGGRRGTSIVSASIGFTGPGAPGRSGTTVTCPSSPQSPVVPVVEGGPAELFAAIKFDRANHGYDPDEVEQFLAGLGVKIQELQGLLQATEAQAAAAEAQLMSAGRAPAIQLPADHGPFTSRSTASGVLDRIRFAERSGGYDMAKVDDFLHHAGLRIAELQGLYQRARERCVAAERRLALLNGEASDE